MYEKLLYPLCAILLTALLTQVTRWLPFLLFKNESKMPGRLQFLADRLPMTIMAVLVVYCLKDINMTASPFGAAELISVSAVVLLQLWRRNTLLSVGGGTAIYMILIRTLFKAG